MTVFRYQFHNRRVSKKIQRDLEKRRLFGAAHQPDQRDNHANAVQPEHADTHQVMRRERQDRQRDRPEDGNQQDRACGQDSGGDVECADRPGPPGAK